MTFREFIGQRAARADSEGDFVRLARTDRKMSDVASWSELRSHLEASSGGQWELVEPHRFCASRLGGISKRDKKDVQRSEGKKRLKASLRHTKAFWSSAELPAQNLDVRGASIVLSKYSTRRSRGEPPAPSRGRIIVRSRMSSKGAEIRGPGLNAPKIPL